MPIRTIQLHESGVTLLELMLAIAIVVGVMLSLTYLFPRTSQAIVSNRRRLAASHLTQTMMNAQKQIPFDLMLPTEEIPANFTAAGIGPAQGQCNCSLHMVTMPITSTVVNGVTYNQQICVNLMDQDRRSYCPSYPFVTTLSLKHIQVRVSWDPGTGVTFTEMDSMVASL